MNVGASVSFIANQTQIIAKQASADDDASTKKTNEPQATEAAFNKNQILSALTEQELKQVQELKQRDREVRSHEAAHLAAAGSLAIGGASYTYQRGPDGVQYAVGGKVNIDTSSVPGDPEATLAKAQRIRAAALAPAQPSSQDLRVAAQAAQMAVQARAEIVQAQVAEAENEANTETNETDTSTSSSESPTDNITAQQKAQVIADISGAVNDGPEAILDLIA